MQNTISFQTKFGWITATERKNKINSIMFKRGNKRSLKSPILKKFKKIINMFFNNKIKNINIAIHLNGNFKQKRIWLEIKKIKKGDTSTYGEIGKKLKISARYVGKVCSQNRLILAVPCHRVIRNDGFIGGYSANGGINLKRRLINFEAK
tara:strand:+ start:624 stop:1073 length:450 start_codon:yes stop_codon:yes gene_type:complete